MKEHHAHSAFTGAVAGLRANRCVNVLAVGSIAMASLIVVLCLLAFVNARTALNTLSEEFVLSVYLEHGLSESDNGALLSRIRSIPGVKSAAYISRDMALSRFRQEMRSRESLLIGLDENPLPDSFEIGFHRHSINPAALDALEKTISAYPGVEDLSYSKRGVAMLDKLSRLLDNGGAAAVFLAGFSMACVIFSTVLLTLSSHGKIGMIPLPDEGSGSFRGAFVMEGVLLAIFGTALAIGVLAGLFHWLPRETYLAALPAKLEFLSLPFVGYILAGSGVLGLCGGFLAVIRRRNHPARQVVERME